MTLARRALLAFLIALATALVVAGLAMVDAGDQPRAFEKIQRD